jgi:hypothetical protein
MGPAVAPGRASPSCSDAVVLASMQNAVFGLPYIVSSPASHEGAASGPHGFPFWIRWSHFFNMIFLFMLIRSGLSILVDHPRLYFNDHCTPGSEWIRFTPLRVPTDRVWTAKDDARYISPFVATPRLPSHGRSGTLLALYFRVRVCSDRRLLRVRTSHQRSVAATGAQVETRSSTTPSFAFRLNQTASTGTTPSSNWPTSSRFSSWCRSPSLPAWRCRPRW